jgi:GNAT superfamily N-acetyltransferase
MPTTQVRAVAPSERDAAIHILTLAFVADPAARWLYPEAEAYLSHFPSFARAFGGEAFERETAYLTQCLGGASFWLPPGAHADDEAITAVVRDSADLTNQDQIFSVFEEMDRYHPKEPHWYLAMIGVDPSRQGQGLGAALLKATLAQVDEQGLPAYLESSNPANLPLYERHRFEVQGEIRPGDGPPIIPMLRPAR